MRRFLLFLYVVITTVCANANGNEEFSNGDKCSNGSAVYNVTIGKKHESDEETILYKCRDFDTCPRVSMSY